MSKLMDAIQSYAYTENGALTHNTTGSAVLDLFAMGGALRNRPLEELQDIIRAAFNEDRLRTIQVLLYLRDCRKGLGERRIFIEGMKLLLDEYRDSINVGALTECIIPDLGCFRDMFKIFSPVEAASILEDSITSGIENDYYNLLDKWLPSVTGSQAQYAKEFRKALHMSEKDYRRYLSLARKRTHVLETYLCSNSWDKIQYEHVPSLAMARYDAAFRRHDRDRYLDYLYRVHSGKAKINASVLYPYQIYQQRDNANAQALWDNLPDYTDGRNALVVADVSGSMCGLPLAVSVSLALYFAERNTGIFHNEFMTFSDIPEFVKITGDTLVEKMNNISSARWGMSTNLQEVFSAILHTAIAAKLSEEDMPRTVYIISDMEFNVCMTGTNLEGIKKQYKDSGYTLPKLVFWNVNSRQNNVAGKADDPNILLVSGMSPVIMSMATDADTTPVGFMEKTVAPYRKYAEGLLTV